MRTRKLFYQLFPSYFLISLFGLGVLLLITRFAFENFYYKESSTNLLQKANLIHDKVVEEFNKSDWVALQKKVNEVAFKGKSRVTVILTSGKVVADSDFDAEKMDNHLSREEVKKALVGEVGQSVRKSSTLQEKHLYVAIPLKGFNETSSKVTGVLRTAVSVKKLEGSLNSLTRQVLIWSVLLLTLLSFIIYSQSKKISAPLERLKEQVDSIALENYAKSFKKRNSSTEEINALQTAIQFMSEDLRTKLNKISKQKNEQLAVFASMLEGVITVYPDMNVNHINKSAIKLFNFKGDLTSIKGTPLVDVVKSKRICEMTEKLLRDGISVEHEFAYDSGVILKIHGTVLVDDSLEDSKALGAVLVFSDISQVKALEEHRKQFVANVSHELKTPLTAIQGYLETIQESSDEDPKTIRKFLGIISKHSNRLKLIIEDLLALSSIERESEDEGLEFTRSHVKPIVENVIQLCSEKAKVKGINIGLSGDDCEATINSQLFEQALINLLDNAIKYGPDESDVSVKMLKKARTLQIIVQDQGVGIAEKHHARIFERFYSVDKARSRELGGSGLGLSIVKHIALSHKGNVRLESQVGSGAKFFFELPI